MTHPSPLQDDHDECVDHHGRGADDESDISVQGTVRVTDGADIVAEERLR